jgi:hypothetical protein
MPKALAGFLPIIDWVLFANSAPNQANTLVISWVCTYESPLLQELADTEIRV